MVRSSSDGVAIRKVLTVLWMRSRFHRMGPSRVRIEHDSSIYFWNVHQLAVPVGWLTTSDWLSSSDCGTGGEVCCLRLHCLLCYNGLLWEQLSQNVLSDLREIFKIGRNMGADDRFDIRFRSRDVAMVINFCSEWAKLPYFHFSHWHTTANFGVWAC